VQEAVYFKEEAGTVYVRAEGHVTAALCPGLKSRVFARLDSAPPVERVRVDLSACEYMDSTFLGLIVGMHKRFAPLGKGRIALLGANDACIGLLRTIGVLGLVELSGEEPMLPEGMERVAEGTRASAQFILDAHEELSGLSEENRARFAGLTAVLKGSLKDRNSGSGTAGPGSGG
jgi:anti-anti-sigma factor